MMDKSNLELLILSIITTGLVFGCVEKFQIHNENDDELHSITVKEYPNNESKIINLTITCCLISSIYEYNYTFGHLNAPQTLIIANMKRSQFPVLLKWTGITEIKFMEFYIEIIRAGAFKNLPKLKIINFAENGMSEIPDIKLLGAEGTLVNLILSNNAITIVDIILDAEEIHLNRNPITTINVPFENVKVLNLSETELDTMKNSYVKHPQKLEKLHMAHCSISKIYEDSFCEMFNLEDLNLNYNQITYLDIDIFRDLKNLKILKLSHNQIENLELGLFDNLINLEVLDISDNRIKILDEELLNPLVNLRKFWLNGNRIDWWEVRGIKKQNPNLTEINLMRNKWICGELTFIVKHLEIQNITLYGGDTTSVYSHVKGVPYVYQDTQYSQCKN